MFSEKMMYSSLGRYHGKSKRFLMVTKWVLEYLRSFVGKL